MLACWKTTTKQKGHARISQHFNVSIYLSTVSHKAPSIALIPSMGLRENSVGARFFLEKAQGIECFNVDHSLFLICKSCNFMGIENQITRARHERHFKTSSKHSPLAAHELNY